MIEPPYVPLITSLPDCLTGLCLLPKGVWTEYEDETLHIRRVWRRIGIVTLKLRPELPPDWTDSPDTMHWTVDGSAEIARNIGGH